ncbi:MAG TPA: hypothetical protein ENJ08_03950 [Gammaproteobacteria bacterium]|nr:hypothetical protein [Gammaproteobacteria bacterium]
MKTLISMFLIAQLTSLLLKDSGMKQYSVLPNYAWTEFAILFLNPDRKCEEAALTSPEHHSSINVE